MSELLQRFAAAANDPRTMVIDDAGTSSRADVVRRAMAIRAALVNDGIAPGERVALLVHPSADFLSAFFGVLLAGGCVVVLSPIHPPPESRYFCDDAEVGTILVSERKELRDLGTSIAGTIRLREVSALASGNAEGHLDKSRRSRRHGVVGAEPQDLDKSRRNRRHGVVGAEPQDIAAIAAAITESAPALQLYTSGTTGKPKGAVLTHHNIGIQQRLVGEAWGFAESDVLLHALPLHHMHGLAIALLTAIGAGAAVRLRSFDAPRLWEEMSDATVFMGVPAMYHRLFVAFDGATDAERSRWSENAKQLRLATSGSAALPVTLAERWRDVTGSIPLERFGMTEIGVGITNSLAGPRFAGCVGLPLPTVEAKIVGEDGPGDDDADVGELWIRGPSVFVGYHRRVSETEGAFVADPSGAWFRTGDTVTRDASLPGRPYRILGRTSVDILKSGGYKLSALEIEEVMREHAAVAEVAVVGLSDPAWGDRVVACVVRRGEVSCDAADLRAFVRERLAPYKIPKDVIFLSELPKNALGKVVKPDLVRQIQERPQP
jgi:malonyl-CoA/methylmalonyl-CoA synthetase